MNTRLLKCLRAGCALGAALLLGQVVPAWAKTITTSYQYNADDALTATTTQIDTGAPVTTYLTWANSTRNIADPTTGSVRAADGNLLGLGPSPGPAGLSPQFQYDVRDRLNGCTVSGEPAVSYAYDASSLLSASMLA